jgi:hypothetical protein
VKRSFIKNIVCISSMSLLAPLVTAASSNAPSSETTEIRKIVKEYLVGIEKKQKVLEKKQKALEAKERALEIRQKGLANKEKGLEVKQKAAAKSKLLDPVLALPQANYRPKYNTAPVYNQDLAMLKMRQQFNKKARKNHLKQLPYPRIELGGSIIGVGSWNRSPEIAPTNGRVQTDLNLAGANFDLNTEILPVLLGNLRVSYNPNAPQRLFPGDTTTIVTRLSNSTIFLNTAFLTLGDLNKSPLYVSLGQMFLPFGEYGSSLLTAPLPARLGRMKQRPLLLGFEPKFLPGLNASVFTFKGDTTVHSRGGLINNGGANLSYTLSHAFFSLTTAGSFIGNIADSGGMQNTGPSTIVSDAGNDVDNSFLDEEDLEEDENVGPVNTFIGFGANESLVRRVPALDARARLGLKKLPLSFYGEYLKPTRPFDARNVTFNSNWVAGEDNVYAAARPSAWNAEGSWRFVVWNNPSSLTLGYGQSSEALAFNLPQTSRGITLRTTFKKAVTCSLGFQYDKAYPFGSWATGQELQTKSDNFVGTTTKTLVGQVIAKF